MGFNLNWSSESWKGYSDSSGIDKKKTVDEIFSKVAKSDYLPKGINRESRDSSLHPRSRAMVIGLDTTGSMDRIAVNIAKKFNVVADNLYTNLPVEDPQLMFAFIDDTISMPRVDPLQVTQFEVDTKIIQQLTDLHFTGHGGGNSWESYPLLWYFCARHTSIDCYEKRGEKGFLATLGDDGFPEYLTRQEIYDVFGDTIQEDIKVSDLLQELNKKYEVYHICVEQGGSYRERDYEDIKKLLGSHCLKISDWQKTPELFASLFEVFGGKSVADATKDWDGSTAVVVKDALNGLSIATGEKTGLIEF